jgi:hypothetical protein
MLAFVNEIDVGARALVLRNEDVPASSQDNTDA